MSQTPQNMECGKRDFSDNLAISGVLENPGFFLKKDEKSD